MDWKQMAKKEKFELRWIKIQCKLQVKTWFEFVKKCEPRRGIKGLKK